MHAFFCKQKFLKSILGLIVFLGGISSLHAQRHLKYDLILKGGLIIDGTGREPYHDDIAIRNGKIVKIGHCSSRNAYKTINVHGQWVVPGFIDILCQNDLWWSQNQQHYALERGVTSALTGNCGWSFTRVRFNLNRFTHEPMLLNIGTLIGQGTLRDQVLNLNKYQQPTPQQIQLMKKYIRRALKAGAFGLSSGLAYQPGEWCRPQELVEEASVLKAFPHAAYYTHIRNFHSQILSAVQEAIHVGQVDHIPVIVQHLLIKMPHNWNKAERVFLLFEKARSEGLPVYATIYPYDFWGNEVQLPLSQFLYFPDNVTSLNFYSNPRQYQLVLKKIQDQLQMYGGGKWIEVTRLSPDMPQNDLGKTISQLAQKWKMSDVRTVLALLLKNKEQVGICYHGLSRRNIQRSIQEPFMLFGSDATRHMIDPRIVGAFPRLIAHYVRKDHMINLITLIHRLTEAPAHLMGLKHRGSIMVGNWADLVIFNYQKIHDQATPVHPLIPSQGIRFVLINGQIALHRNQIVSNCAGHVLRRSNH